MKIYIYIYEYLWIYTYYGYYICIYDIYIYYHICTWSYSLPNWIISLTPGYPLQKPCSCLTALKKPTNADLKGGGILLLAFFRTLRIAISLLLIIYTNILKYFLKTRNQTNQVGQRVIDHFFSAEFFLDPPGSESAPIFDRQPFFVRINSSIHANWPRSPRSRFSGIRRSR